MPASVRLRMLDNGYRVDVEAVQGTLTWLLTGCVPPAPTPDADGDARHRRSPTPTPSPTTTPTGPPCPPAQPQGARWQLRLDDATHSQFVLWDLGVTPRKQLWQGGSAAVPLRLQRVRRGGPPHDLARLRRSTSSAGCAGTGPGSRSTAPLLDAVQQIDTTDTGAAMDKYLWGIAEVPASFPAAALQAQAIAARTFAAKRADRVLMPTPADQNWTGWKKETEGTNGAWGLKWKAAVDATSGQVVADAASGALIDAFYSSSMGGHTEDERYVWGVEAPFLRAVDDSTWDAASSNPAEKRSWAAGVTWATLAAGSASRSISTMSVPPRGADSRVAGVKVVGHQGRRAHHVVRRWLGRPPGARPAVARLHDRDAAHRRPGRASRWSATGTATARRPGRLVRRTARWPCR